MTLTQALALRPGTRVTLTPSNPTTTAMSGRVIANGRKVGIAWHDGPEQFYDHRYMHYVHVLVETAALAEA